MDDFYVVGIGASAGGLEAVQQFFSSMTPVRNMAFVVVQHLSPDYKSYMPELLARHTEMPVHQIKYGMHMEPGCIYLNPPKYNVIITKDHFELISQDPPPRVNLAIDAFLESLAASKQERSIGIILSGTGNDGTRGCRAVKEAGGIVIVQNETAKFDGMPNSVISMKLCDYILPPGLMPEVLIRYSGNSPVTLDKLPEIYHAEENTNPLSAIFSILKKQYSTNFTLYKQSTILENCDTVGKLQERIADLEQELQYTRESLQASIEEVETSSEELQSANEELLVSNEELHSTNEELRRSMEQYEKLVELSPYAILIVRDGKIQFSNNEGINLFQAGSVEKLTGKSIGNYIDLDGIMQKDRLYQSRHSETGTIVPREDVISRPDGTEIIVEVMYMPVDFGNLPSQLVIFRDITYRKLSERLQEDNENGKRLLEEALTFDNLKNDFFSNISHEIRTPLNVIMSTLQLLESQIRNNGGKPAGVDLKKHIGIIRQNCYRQLRLINNMIDMTKMDSGFYEVKMQNQNIVNIVENITLSVSDYAKAKSIDLIFDTDVEEKIIACSPDCIERIMLNLLSNAVKFTEKGGSISVNMYDRHDRIQICVKDTGAGIPDGKLDVIFDRFRQVDKSLTRAHEGSGIGLSLVKSLVELHNGNISVNSKYGAGSEFIITLPVSTVPDDTENSGGIDEMSQNSNVERINLEFSDVYSIN